VHVESEEPGRSWVGRARKNENMGWFWRDREIGRLCSSAWRAEAEELEDPPYVPQLPDLADEHTLVITFLGDLTWPRNIRTHLMFLGLSMYISYVHRFLNRETHF
jgi:hypothetical protein